jgi:hypothetical protein
MSFISGSMMPPKSSWEASPMRVDEEMMETITAEGAKISGFGNRWGMTSKPKLASGFTSSIFEQHEP